MLIEMHIINKQRQFFRDEICNPWSWKGGGEASAVKEHDIFMFLTKYHIYPPVMQYFQKNCATYINYEECWIIRKVAGIFISAIQFSALF